MALIFISERPDVQFRGFLSIFQPQIGTVVPFLTEFSTDVTEVVVPSDTVGHHWTRLYTNGQKISQNLDKDALQRNDLPVVWSYIHCAEEQHKVTYQVQSLHVVINQLLSDAVFNEY